MGFTVVVGAQAAEGNVFDRHEGTFLFIATMVVAVVTGVLVFVTWRSHRQTRGAIDAATDANEIARQDMEIQRRVARGANVVIRINESAGTPTATFDVWRLGPQDGRNASVELDVEGLDWKGPRWDLGWVRSQGGAAPSYVLTAARVPSSVDGRRGRFVGSCTNEMGEPEPIRSEWFGIVCPKVTEDLALFEVVKAPKDPL